jgi:hypothetical protein
MNIICSAEIKARLCPALLQMPEVCAVGLSVFGCQPADAAGARSAAWRDTCGAANSSEERHGGWLMLLMCWRWFLLAHAQTATGFAESVKIRCLAPQYKPYQAGCNGCPALTAAAAVSTAASAVSTAAGYAEVVKICSLSFTSTQPCQPASTTALTAAAATAAAAAAAVSFNWTAYEEGVKIRSLSPHHNPTLPACQHYGCPSTHCCWCCCCCCDTLWHRLCTRCQDSQSLTAPQPSPASLPALRHPLLLRLPLLLLLLLQAVQKVSRSTVSPHAST